MNTSDCTGSPAAGPAPRYIAFEGHRQLAFGDLREVAEAAKEANDRGDHAAILVFDHPQSRPVELDLRGSLADVLERLGSGDSTSHDAKPIGGPKPIQQSPTTQTPVEGAAPSSVWWARK